MQTVLILYGIVAGEQIERWDCGQLADTVNQGKSTEPDHVRKCVVPIPIDKRTCT